MGIEQISAEEVMRAFVSAHAFKEKIRDVTDTYNRRIGTAELEDRYGTLNENLRNMDIAGFIEERDPIRLQRYKDMNWHKTDKRFSQMGVWPKMQSIDIELTRGSAIKTARGMQKVLDGKSNLIVPDRFIRKMNSIRENSEFILPRFTPILFPGGEVREKDYNVWARENGEPLCKILDYDIDDGSSRIVSYAFGGVTEMPVYVGEYKS